MAKGKQITGANRKSALTARPSWYPRGGLFFDLLGLNKKMLKY
jgi:hypothetical protein